MKSYLNEILSKTNTSFQEGVGEFRGREEVGWMFHQGWFNLLLTFVDKSHKTDEKNKSFNIVTNIVASLTASHLTQ